METDGSQGSLNWLDTWRMAFLHPTVQTFSRIISDSRASIRWGVFWAAIASCLGWLLGPLRPAIWGWMGETFGMLSPWPVTAGGAVLSLVLGATALLVWASIGHGLARLFRGQGTFRQLVYCWGVLQVPFVLVAGLVLQIPLIFQHSPGTPVSMLAIVFTIAKMVAATLVILYLIYAEVVAFGVVQRFSLWKGFGVLVMLYILLGIIAACLSTALRWLLVSAYAY